MTNYKNRHSLVWQIALPFALLLIAATGILSLYLSSYFRESYLSIFERSLLAETRLVADRMGSVMSGAPSDASLQEIANYYSDTLDTRVTVITPNGVVLAESYDDAGKMENHSNRPEIQRALQGTTNTEIRPSETLGVTLMYAATPIYTDGELAGVVRLAVSLRSIQVNLNQIQATVFGAAAVALGFTLLLAFLVASYTIRPVKRLTETVQSFAEGRLEKIGPTHRKDEIGHLHQAFHQMAQQLNLQISNLQTERSKLEVVLANMTDGILIVDQQGMVELINPAALSMFGIEDGDALGKPLIEVVRQHQLVELWRKSRFSGEQETVTLEMSPSRLFIQGIATSLHESLPDMTLLLFQDLTRVRRLETVRRDFVSNVSHELRTPLASLKAITETLQESALEDPPAARRFLQRMEIEIDNLTQMVHELLELSRIESNRVPLKRRPVPVHELTEPAVERMLLQAQRAGLIIRAETPPDLPLVRADPERISQVLINLIHNAIKYTKPGGEILISAYPEGSNVVIFVRDNGAGIPDDTLPRIFERFYKADRSRSGGGTGLGLSIARHIVEAHGGRIWAESEVNQGSCFYFTLPTAA